MDGNKSNNIPTFMNCNGIRYAVPYDSTTNPIYLKDKFVGQTLDVVLGQMFRRHRGTQPIEEAAAHWSKEIKAGRVEIRRKKTCREDPWEWKRVTDIDQGNIVVCKGDSVRMHQHVHEKVVPASASNIQILFENEKWIAISKPGGLATLDEFGKGANSLLTLVKEEILSRRDSDDSDSGNKERNKKLNLQLAHRLDKPVSGVLLIGKSPGQAAALLREIQSATKGQPGGVQKTYVARVRRNPESVRLIGAPDIHVADEFPEEITVELELGWDNNNKKAIAMMSNTEAFTERVSSRMQSQEGQDRRDKRKDEVRKELANGGREGKINDRAEEEKTRSPPIKKRKSAEATTKVHTTRFCRRNGTQQADGTFLVECVPMTGQRHQIRAHLAAIGWPIANDTTYVGNSEKVCVGTNKLLAYVDNEAGTLKRALGSPEVFRPWCPKCNWTMRMLSASSKENSAISNKQGDGEVDDLRQLEVENEIWLHSMRYVLPKAGLDITAPLPEWAQPQ